MKKINTCIQLLIIGSLAFACSKSEPLVIPNIQTSSAVENLFKHSREFTQNVYSYEDGIHAAVGYGIANSYLVEGDEFNIIIDATDSVFQAKKVYGQKGFGSEYRKSFPGMILRQKPFSACSLLIHIQLLPSETASSLQRQWRQSWQLHHIKSYTHHCYTQQQPTGLLW